MSLLEIVIVLFMIFELTNVLALYFAPGSRYANSVGVFNAWDKSKQHPEIHNFVKYLVYWVAGAKLIFLLLLGVIVLFAGVFIQRMTLIALTIATLAFYWRLFPLIRKIDRGGGIRPENYSIILAIMILLFQAVFVTALLMTL
jgi:hypothetical protein